ncbi:phosphoribosylanthranilate isomerase [Myroides pelagicus]|uniref:N-(5'-phosphoribosyl)anthranilate isomerase n=1 Tax=Myroides pelagicus TaxID=270914 RepID=A0A7K1GLD8_9FLAO|nr:phosphoribosylanthranilate isomerase [Myroides pelagicus]MEC4112953.1 phosphoribosylanthranilate isomerase [Myroides pelagicus]MTH29044.1 phosphoribosylanthranilate isomerase [Myroides pelagicus]
MKQVKICGMKDPENIKQLCKLPIDYIGLIFYPKSKRYIGHIEETILDSIPTSVKKVGVFVNEKTEEVLHKKKNYKLDYIQLHGNETVNDCALYKTNGINVIKAFSIGKNEDLEQTLAYSPYCDAFIFDTPTPTFGGSGKVFNWNLLNEYQGNTPYLLSGGLGIHNIQEAMNIQDNRLIGYDINSQIEQEHYLKNITLATQLVQKIKKHEGI